MKQQIVIASLGIVLLLGGCASSSKKSYKDTSKQSANNFYNAGMLRCSVSKPTFDDVCDYAVYYEKKVMKIIVENSAIHNSIAYRVLYFAGGKFKTQNKKEVVRSQKLASNHYQITIGREFYLLPARAMTYQPMDENLTSSQKNEPTPSIVSKEKVVEPEVVTPVVQEAPKPVTQPKITKKQSTSKGTKRVFKR